MKKYLVIMLVLCSIANAQNIVTGRVVNQQNAPLSNASIQINRLNKGTVTNSKGEFRLSNLPNGKIIIQFSYVGYENKVETLILNNSNVELNIKLRETVIEAEGVVVSGAYNSTQHDNAVKIDVFDLATQSHPIANSFMATLTKIPGVDMISKGSGVAKPVIRGLSMSDIVVLNNNVRNENYQYSDHHPLGIDEYGIDKVEVIKGPASLLYGSDAIGGVINFIAERPASVDKIIGDYNLQLFSNSLGMTNNIGIKGATENFIGGIRFGNKTNSDYLQGEGDFVPNTRYYGNTFKSNIGYHDQSMSLNLFYDYSSNKVGIAESDAIDYVKSQGRARKPEVYYMDLDNQLLSTQNKFFISDYLLEVNASYQNAGLVHYEGLDEISIDMNLQTISYETRLYFPSSAKSDYIIGLQGINQINSNNNNRDEILLPDANINNYSIYGLVKYKFFEMLNFQAGLRFDSKQIRTESIHQIDNPEYRPALDKDIHNISGSIGATLNLTESLLFRLNFASSFRSPTLPELTSKGLHEERYELGNSNLVNEKGYETDVSMHYHVTNFTFELAGFYNILDNYIYLSPSEDTSSAGDNIYKYMQQNSNLYGVEVGGHFHPELLPWFHIQANFSSVIGKKINGEYLPFIPANKFQCELMLKPDNMFCFENPYLKINLLTAFNQNNPAPEEEVTSGYTIIDFGLGAEFSIANQKVNIGIDANNILDKKYIDHLSTLKEVGYYNPGRNIALSLKIPFDIK